MINFATMSPEELAYYQSMSPEQLSAALGIGPTYSSVANANQLASQFKSPLFSSWDDVAKAVTSSFDSALVTSGVYKPITGEDARKQAESLGITSPDAFYVASKINPVQGISLTKEPVDPYFATMGPNVTGQGSEYASLITSAQQRKQLEEQGQFNPSLPEQLFGNTSSYIYNSLESLKNQYGVQNQNLQIAYQAAIDKLKAENPNYANISFTGAIDEGNQWSVNREKLIVETLKTALQIEGRYDPSYDEALNNYIQQGETSLADRQRIFEEYQRAREEQRNSFNPLAIVAGFAAAPFIPQIGALLGASSSLAPAVGSAVVNATTAALSGQNPLQAAATGALGSLVGQLGVPGAETGAFDQGLGLDVMTGGAGIVNPTLLNTGAFDAGIGLDVMAGSQPAFVADYSLLAGSNFPQTGAGLQTGTGITSTLPPLPEPSAIGVQPVDYSLVGQTVPGVFGGLNLQVPEMPNLGGMGGGQGLTVPVDTGTVGQLGLTPTGATPVLGSPSSFINNPDVLGQPVMQQGTPASGISATDAIRAVNAVNNLLNPAQQPQPQQQPGQQAGFSPTGIDYSGLLSLLATRPSTLGLLGTRFNPYSLMG